MKEFNEAQGRRLLLRAALAAVLVCAGAARPALAQRNGAEAGDSARDTTAATGITAGGADGERRRRQLIEYADLDLGIMTLHLGGGLLFEGIAYAQDDASRQQFDLKSEFILRDARFLFNGRVQTRRPITWQIGVMYDQVTKKWLYRQSGLMIAVPEISSHFFIGRAKEGFSLNKVMTGYDGWSMERLPFTDATVPLLADGVKWLARTRDRHWFWNLGLFTDWQSEGQSFSSYDNQFVARIGWVPMVADSIGTMLHIALNGRTGEVNNGVLQLRSRPEAFPAPYFVDTGPIPAQTAHNAGVEVYYRPGEWLFGTEYSWQKVSSEETGDPWFHGGEVVAAWLVTGETRSYNTVGNYFRAVSPNRTVIQGGPGAIEAVLKFSYTDLDHGEVRGGTFWRITPMLNWHLTDNVRFEMAYGYGRLDRLGLIGGTHFFQTRLQMQL